MSGSFIQRGGLWVLAQVVLILVVIVSGVAWRHQWQSAWSVFVGACLLLAGGVCGLAGVAALGRNLTAYPQPSLRARLVQTGIYRWIRHPIYTAGLCVLPGWSLVWQSWPALLAALAMA